MPNPIESIGRLVGSAIKSYQRGVSASGFRVERPEFLSWAARLARWNGGDFGMQDAAVRRAMVNSWVYTAIHRKAFELSAGRMHVVYNPEGLEETGTVIPGHRLIKILKHPNPLMGRQSLWMYTHLWLDLIGNGYWFLLPDESGKNLAEIWPLPANDVYPIPGSAEDYVDHYDYYVNGRLFRIPAMMICHFKYPNPFDMFRGLSPLQAAILPADSDMAMARWNGAFFGRDNVMPSAIISLSSGDSKAPIDPSDIQAVQDELTNEYSASSRKTIVTNAYNMQAQLLGYNAKDMDFNAGRQFTKEEIFLIYGIPPGLLDKSATEANAVVADNIFKEKTIWPTMGLYAETITAQILDRYYHEDEEARWTDIRPINRELKMKEGEASTGVMTIDERRDKFWNLKPLPNGEGKHLAMNAGLNGAAGGARGQMGGLTGQGALATPASITNEMGATLSLGSGLKGDVYPGGVATEVTSGFPVEPNFGISNRGYGAKGHRGIEHITWDMTGNIHAAKMNAQDIDSALSRVPARHLVGLKGIHVFDAGKDEDGSSTYYPPQAALVESVDQPQSTIDLLQGWINKDHTDRQAEVLHQIGHHVQHIQSKLFDRFNTLHLGLRYPEIVGGKHDVKYQPGETFAESYSKYYMKKPLPQEVHDFWETGSSEPGE